MAASGKDRQGKTGSADGKIVIKKYANRRLYNTAKSSYVTLDDLSQMVRAGDDFAVFDAKSGDDITRSVLAQIIFEEEAKGQNMLPTNFLRQIIRLYGDALQGVVPGYLEASMDAFNRNQEQMRKTFAGSSAIANFETLARGNMELFEQSLKMFAPFAAGDGSRKAGPAETGKPPSSSVQGGAGPAREPASAAEIGQDLDALQRQIAEVKRQLDSLSKPEAPGGKE